ncbi:GNAT family N-acetyltransferase [Phenylobacterium sp. LjRoot219]|uniref:GNAT family N-acetyltransferase n=1 Tax=Phenylobacterium sp. LjRoot219 TaxID=3342283 RepID=UPI003ED0D906
MSAWRPARPADAGEIGRLSRALLSAFPERDAVFEERIRLCPEGCHVLAEGADVLGYLVSHPWRRFDPPKLDALLGALPADPDCWLVHDVAVDPRARGGGAALKILDQVADLARDRGFRVLALVALGQALAYWRRQGFTPGGGAQLAAKLGAYGDGAAYMERPL